MGLFSKLFGKLPCVVEKSQQQVVPPTTRTLPDLTSDHLHDHFGDQPENAISGPGANVQKEAVQAWNNDDHDRAFSLYKEVVNLGLNEEYDMSLMHESLGELYLKRTDVPNAVDQFQKCLSIHNRAPSGAWQAAMRLYYIYDAVGRGDEAAGARKLADKANRDLNWAHEPSLEEEIREIARQSGVS